MASSRAIIIFFAATIFVDQALSLSSYEADRLSKKRAALSNDLDDNKDPGDVNSLRRCVRALAGDVIAMRRSLRGMRRSDPGAFNAGMGQMQENEMQMQLMLDTDDLQNGGNLGQYPPGIQMNGYPNSPFSNPQNSPYGAYEQQPQQFQPPQQLQPPQQFQQQPQFSPYQQFQQPDQSATPYGYPSNSGMPMNPMGMPVNRPYSNNQMEAMRRLLNGNNGSPELGHKPHSGNHSGPHHGRSLHSRSTLPGNRAY